jgi:hypothetical protein
MVFGITLSVCDKFLKFGRSVQNEPASRCTLPDAENIPAFFKAIQDKHNALSNYWGVVDGLKLYLAECGNAVIQNAFYNG